MTERFRNKLSSLTEGILETPHEYVMTADLGGMFGTKAFPITAESLAMALKDVILFIGKKWLRQRVHDLDIAVIGNKAFIKLKVSGSVLTEILQSMSGIEKVEYNYKISIPPFPTEPIGILTHETTAALGFTEIHKDPRFNMGRDLIVGIVDTGVGDPSKPKNRALPLFVNPKDTTSEYRVKKFRDFVAYKTEPYDDMGHGEAVAEIVAGAEIYQSGLKRTYIGAVPQATIYCAKVLDRNGSGTLFNVILGIQWMGKQEPKPDVVNLSLGTNQNTDGTDAVSQAVDALWDLGIVVVVAAGNSGQSKASPPYCNGTVGSPACAFKVVKTFASSGIKPPPPDAVQAWSSRPPTSDGRKGPEFHGITAPGYSIGVYDNRMTGKSGTSFASPYDSGHALVIEMALRVKGIAHDNDYVRDLMEKYCETLGYKERYGEEEGWCIEGFGEIRPFKAWQAITGGEQPQECIPGAIEIIETCPDGSWHKQRVCDSTSHWGPVQERVCPTENKIAIAHVTVKVNGKEVYNGESDQSIGVEVIAIPELRGA